MKIINREFKKGDIIRIKSYEEIKKTLDNRGFCNGIYFSNYMAMYCDTNQIIKEINSREILIIGKDDYWIFNKRWIDFI